MGKLVYTHSLTAVQSLMQIWYRYEATFFLIMAFSQTNWRFGSLTILASLLIKSLSIKERPLEWLDLNYEVVNLWKIFILGPIYFISHEPLFEDSLLDFVYFRMAFRIFGRLSGLWIRNDFIPFNWRQLYSLPCMAFCSKGL